MAQMRRLRPIHVALLGAAAVLAAQALAGLAYLGVGGFNVAASVPHTRLTYGLTHEMMVRSVRRHARGLTPPAFTPQAAQHGLQLYAAHCAECHGAPVVDVRARWVDGLTPAPPYLIDSAHDFSPAELFWIVKHGVKMTGMPAWARACSDAEIWDVVAFLEALPKLPATAYRDMTQASGASPPAGGCLGPGG
jgi:mono/diheme cytochrome c family protein